MSGPRGTTNSNVRGNTRDREARRAFLLRKFGNGTTAPCYRCGVELDASSVTVDRIIPGFDGGKYVQANIRPACAPCNTETGSVLASRNRRREHVCIDCLALPELFRPKAVRKIAEGCGPRSQRCTSHKRIFDKAQRLKRKQAWVTSTKGITSEEYDALLAFQGGTCAIPGCPANGSRKRLAVDHDHACCLGPISCGRCVRGLVCGPHNYELLGKYANDLQAGLDYLDNPPMARLRAARRSAA